MPRQGARRRAREAATTRGARAPRCKDAQQAECDQADSAPAQNVDGQAADFESALGGSGGTAEKLFELANKPAVRLSVGEGFVQVAQDRKATEHSGGVVWETAFFLARYLEKHVLPGRGGDDTRRLRVLELGAGCGLMGLALARLGCRVFLTEQPTAMDNLRSNVAAHLASSSADRAKALQLVWGDATDIAAVRAKGPFDLIVASDVVFAARFVKPLLETIAALLAAPGRDNSESAVPECWLCLQQRDPDAHAQLLALAPEFFRTSELHFDDLPGFEAAAELECVLLRFRLRKRLRTSAMQQEAVEPNTADEEPEVREAKAPKAKRHKQLKS